MHRHTKLAAATLLLAACSGTRQLDEPPVWEQVAALDHLGNTQVDILFVIDTS